MKKGLILSLVAFAGLALSASAQEPIKIQQQQGQKNINLNSSKVQKLEGKNLQPLKATPKKEVKNVKRRPVTANQTNKKADLKIQSTSTINKADVNKSARIDLHGKVADKPVGTKAANN